MAQMTPQASELLQKALELSSHERGQLIDRLIESLDEALPEEGAEQAWAAEIRRRVDDIRSGRVDMISGQEVQLRLARRLQHGGE